MVARSASGTKETRTSLEIISPPLSDYTLNKFSIKVILLQADFRPLRLRLITIRNTT